MIRRFFVLPIFVVSMFVISMNVAAQIVVSAVDGLQISVSSQVTPIPLNQMHSWVITLTTAEGEAVENATIRVDGGMPAHDHGLATSPQVTDYLGAGQYLLQGLRFHMAGEWLMDIQIEHDGRRYRSEAALQAGAGD